MANWAPKSAGPNLPPNRRGAQFAGAQFASNRIYPMKIEEEKQPTAMSTHTLSLQTPDPSVDFSLRDK